jgi:hypothetical protein
VGPRAGLEAVAKRKKSLPCPIRESNLGRPDRSEKDSNAQKERKENIKKKRKQSREDGMHDKVGKKRNISRRRINAS